MAADVLLTDLGYQIPQEPPFLELNVTGSTEVLVFGDTHGDWRTTALVGQRFLERPGGTALVGLGDYVDRPPSDCPGGSAVNALYLLGLKARYPDRVFLLQGNHELARTISVRPHTLPEEIRERWGPDRSRYARLMGLLERGPIAATTPSGVYLAHGGFPGKPLEGWRSRLLARDPPTVMDVAWRDARDSRLDRGASPPFGGEELRGFLEESGLSVFLRGHDPDLTGRRLYGDRCLTLHTARHFEECGGVLLARAPFRAPVRDLRDVAVEKLPGRVAEAPAGPGAQK